MLADADFDGPEPHPMALPGIVGSNSTVESDTYQGTLRPARRRSNAVWSLEDDIDSVSVATPPLGEKMQAEPDVDPIERALRFINNAPDHQIQKLDGMKKAEHDLLVLKRPFASIDKADNVLRKSGWVPGIITLSGSVQLHLVTMGYLDSADAKLPLYLLALI